MCSSGLGQKRLAASGAGLFLVGLLFLLPAAALFVQNSLPVELLRPQQGEAPRFPKDYQIGELGRGEAGEEAFQAARRLLSSLIYENGADMLPHIKESLEAVRGMEIRLIRIGGGRNEADGSASFMIRFLGRTEAIAGECYLRLSTGTEEWRLDDIIFDKRRPLGEGPFSPENAISTQYDRLL